MKDVSVAGQEGEGNNNAIAATGTTVPAVLYAPLQVLPSDDNSAAAKRMLHFRVYEPVTASTTPSSPTKKAASSTTTSTSFQLLGGVSVSYADVLAAYNSKSSLIDLPILHPLSLLSNQILHQFHSTLNLHIRLLSRTETENHFDKSLEIQNGDYLKIASASGGGSAVYYCSVL